MQMTPEPFLMFGLTCRQLARACDSGDRRGCSFLNTMSETRRQEAGMCSVLSAAPDRTGLFFNEEDLHLESFFHVSHRVDKSAARHAGPK